MQINHKQGNKKVVIPVIFGAISFLSLVGYFVAANNYRNISLPYRAIDFFVVVWAVAPLLGIAVSIATRQYRKVNSALWWSGIILCGIDILLLIFLIVILVGFALAVRDL